MTRCILGTLCAAVLLLAPSGAQAQVAWESPMLMAPGSGGGVGIYVVEPHGGDEVGALVTWRNPSVPGGLGFRVGLAEGFADDLAAYGGVDASGMVMQATDEFPLDVIWIAGAGLGAGDYVWITLPAGLSFGRTFTEQGVRFTPYVSPRIFLDAHLGRDLGPGADDDELNMGVAVDVGADLAFNSRWAIRFGASLGDHDALAAGVSFPGVR